MGIGLTIVLIVLAICATILLAMYIYYCGENEVKMFADKSYDERIRKLEIQIKGLEKKK